MTRENEENCVLEDDNNIGGKEIEKDTGRKRKEPTDILEDQLATYSKEKIQPPYKKENGPVPASTTRFSDLLPGTWRHCDCIAAGGVT